MIEVGHTKHVVNPIGRGAIPTCRDMSELVTAYLDRALPLRARLAARLHLLLCRACARYYDQMRKTIRLLARAPHAAPNSEVERQLLDAIAARGDHPPS